MIVRAEKVMKNVCEGGKVYKGESWGEEVVVEVEGGHFYFLSPENIKREINEVKNVLEWQCVSGYNLIAG